jgi:hypothetical protein
VHPAPAAFAQPCAAGFSRLRIVGLKPDLQRIEKARR